MPIALGTPTTRAIATSGRIGASTSSVSGDTENQPDGRADQQCAGQQPTHAVAVSLFRR